MFGKTANAEPHFPGHDHQLVLRQKCKTTTKDRNGNEETTGYDTDKLNNEDKWFWYAYDYAFRRLAMQDRSDVCPTDPHKQWFDEDLVDRAEIAFSREMGIDRP